MTYSLWLVKVNEIKKPFSFEKVKKLAEVDQTNANKIYETSMKHPHVAPNILWMRIADEKRFGVAAKTFVLLEDYDWTKPAG